MPNLFISYSSKDRDRAEELEKLLHGEGHKVWRDKTRLEADWSQEIAFALADADALCLVWSANAAASKWVSHEWFTARALEKRIFVLFVDETSLPEPLSTIDGDFKPSALLERVGRAASFHFRYDFTAASAPVFIPFRPNPEFRGRHSDLLELYLGMIGNLKRTGINQVGAVGSGGIGKTQLAVEFAWRFGFAFEGIYWIQAADERLWVRQFVEVARDHLRLEIEDTSGSDTHQHYLRALQSYCRRKPNLLFIMDNVSEPQRLNSAAALEGTPPLDLGASILFTTRRRFELPGVSQHSVGILSPPAAKELLTAGRAAATPDEQEAAKQICNAAGYLPLALVLIAGLLRKRPRLSYVAYLAELRKKRLDSIDLGQVSAEELATRHLASVEDTLAEQWKTLKDAHGRRLFRLLGFFSEAAIVPKVRLGLLAGLEFSDTLTDPLQDAFNELQDLHLAEELEDGASVRLHPLVRDFAARLTPQAKLHKTKAEAAKTLTRLYLDPARLGAQISTRGANPVREDFAIAFSWHPELEGDERDLYRLLNREDFVSGWGGASVFRQLQHRAACMNMPRLSELYAGAEPFLRTSFVSRYDDPGRVRSFPEATHRLAISPDGSTAVGGSLIQWDYPSGRILRNLAARMPGDVAITVDSRYAVCGSEWSLLCLDLQTGEEVWRVRGHDTTISALALSADGRLAVTGDQDGSTLLWDIARREVIRRFSAPGTWVQQLAFHSSGRSFLRVDLWGALHLFDIAREEPVREFVTDPRSSFTCAAFALDGEHVVTGTSSGDVALWDCASAAPLHTFDRLHRGINSLAVGPDGSFALTASNDLSLIRWNLKERVAERRFIGHTEEVYSVVIAPDGRTALSAPEWEKEGILWDISTEQPIHGTTHWNTVAAIIFSQDGSHVLSGDGSGTLILWDVAGRRCLRKFESGSKGIAGVALSPDMRHALTGDYKGVITLWDIESFEPVRRYKGLGEASHYPTFACGGRPCAVVSKGQKLTLKDLDTRKPLRTFKREGKEYLNKFVLLSDGRRVLCSEDSQLLTLWDLDSARPLNRWENRGLAFHRGGALVQGDSYLALTHGHVNLELWNLSTVELTASLYMSNPVTAVAAHGSTIVVADFYGTLHFLEV